MVCVQEQQEKLKTAGATELRQAIRETWGAHKRLDRVIFFVFKPAGADRFMRLRDEAVQFGDIVVTSHANEAYLNCTYIVLDMFRTMAHIGTATHILKTDEDCYVRVTIMLQTLQTLPQSWLYCRQPPGSR